MTLASVLTFMGLLVLIPSWIFFKKSITFMVGYVSLPLAVALGMWLQGVFRNQKKLWDPTTNTNWLFIDIGTDRLLGVVALVGAILIAAQSGILTAGLVNCQSWTAQGLAQLIFGANLNGTAVSDWTAQYRVPDFATQVLTYQMCLDDYALTIVYVVVGFATMIVMVLAAVEQCLSRDQSLRLYKRLDLYKKQAAQDLANEQTDEADDRPTMAGIWQATIPAITTPLARAARGTERAARGVKDTPTRTVHELRPF